MRKVIFFDIDGTLIDVPRGLSEPSNLSKYAISELMKNGNIVFIASGRYKNNLPKSIIDLQPSGYVLSNGAYIEYQGKVISESFFDRALFDEVCRFCDENNALFLGETQNYVYSPKLDDRFHNFFKKWKIEYVNAIDKKDGVNFYKCCAFFDNHESAQKFEEKFKGLLDYRAQTADPTRLSYDINVIGINKGHGVKEVIKKLNINKEDTYCFCDGTNDLELVEACKNSYVLSNGDEILKKIAYGIAGDVINDGVYHKLVELELIKEKK